MSIPSTAIALGSHIELLIAELKDSEQAALLVDSHIAIISQASKPKSRVRKKRKQGTSTTTNSSQCIVDSNAPSSSPSLVVLQSATTPEFRVPAIWPQKQPQEHPYAAYQFPALDNS